MSIIPRIPQVSIRYGTGMDPHSLSKQHLFMWLAFPLDRGSAATARFVLGGGEAFYRTASAQDHP